MGSFDFFASHWKDLAKIGELAEHIVQYMFAYENNWHPPHLQPSLTSETIRLPPTSAR